MGLPRFVHSCRVLAGCSGNAKFIRKPIAVNIHRGESVAQPGGGLIAAERPFGDRGSGRLRATNILGRR